MNKVRTTPVNFGNPVYVIRSRHNRLSVRIDRRALIVCSLLTLSIVMLILVSLVSGKYPVSLLNLWEIFLGKSQSQIKMIVMEWRLPRIILAFFLGCALGISGAIFQSLTRNPLGSPDIIGFSAGSYTGALLVILLVSGSYYQIVAGALLGGILSAVAVYLLAWKSGIQGFRLILVGIGIAAILSALNAWMIRDAELQLAMVAAIWGAGSLNGLGYEQLVPVAIVFLILLPLTFSLSRAMRQLETGDDMARSSGVDAGRVRLFLLVSGVAFTAIVTAAAGPISFISLAAPQIAKRLTKTAGITLFPAMLMGGVLLLIADWLAQHAFNVQLPAGLMTVSIGGAYFIWLLIRESRS